MRYQNYSFKDFILDEQFQQWVLEPDSDNNLFWINWLQNHPEKQPEFTKAKAAILELHLTGLRKEQAYLKKKSYLERIPSFEDINTTWENIALALKAPELAPLVAEAAPPTKVISIFAFNNWVKVAASILLILAFGAIFWFRPKSVSPVEEITYSTTFGETKKLTLPDKSIIYLNANSHLTTAKHWPAEADREVKLAGEAFFSVVHTQNNHKFKVTLQKGARVEVLGTEFTITERPALSRVVLSRGKVKVEVNAPQKLPSGSLQPSAVIMNAGDLVDIDQLHGTLSKSKIPHPEYYAAFTKNLVEFNNTPLGEVARVLQDDFGYKVTFLPASLANKRFTSSNPSNRIDLLLFAIEKSFNLKVKQKGKHITIQAK